MIVTTYVECDSCGKKIVTEVTDAENESLGNNKILISSLTGITEYDFCDECLARISILTGPENDAQKREPEARGRKVILSTYEVGGE